MEKELRIELEDGHITFSDTGVDMAIMLGVTNVLAIETMGYDEARALRDFLNKLPLEED